MVLTFFVDSFRCILRGMRNNVLYIVDEALREEESDEVADALAELLRLLRGIPSLETMIRDSNLNQRHFKWQQECK